MSSNGNGYAGHPLPMKDEVIEHLSQEKDDALANWVRALEDNKNLANRLQNADKLIVRLEQRNAQLVDEISALRQQLPEEKCPPSTKRQIVAEVVEQHRTVKDAQSIKQRPAVTLSPVYVTKVISIG
jgi:hypothetical protein